jgi:hypothetical protein
MLGAMLGMLGGGGMPGIAGGDATSTATATAGAVTLGGGAWNVGGGSASGGATGDSAGLNTNTLLLLGAIASVLVVLVMFGGRKR